MARTINTKARKIAPGVYRHKYDAQVEHSALQPLDITITENGGKYAPDGYGYTSVIVNVPAVTYPTVTFSMTPDTQIFEKGVDGLGELIFGINAVKGSKDIERIRIRINDSVVHEITEDVSDGGVFSYTHEFSVPKTSDFTVKVEVYDTANYYSTAEKSIKFVAKSFYGVIGAEDEINETTIKKLQSRFNPSNNMLISGINSALGKVVYAFPATFGDISSIKDTEANSDNFSSFTKTSVTIDGTGYYCYSLTTAAALNDLQLLFY